MLRPCSGAVLRAPVVTPASVTGSPGAGRFLVEGWPPRHWVGGGVVKLENTLGLDPSGPRPLNLTRPLRVRVSSPPPILGQRVHAHFGTT